MIESKKGSKAAAVNESSPVETPKKRGRPKGSKRPGSRPDLKKRWEDPEGVAPGSNAEITDYSLRLFHLERVDLGDRDAVMGRVEEYFQICMDCDMKPGVAGLCLALKMSREAWKSWGSGRTRQYQDMVAEIRQILESNMEQAMVQGKINPIPAIFLMKNHFGYRDQTETVVAHVDALGTKEDMERLQQKYLEKSAPIEVEGGVVEET